MSRLSWADYEGRPVALLQGGLQCHFKGAQRERPSGPLPSSQLHAHVLPVVRTHQLPLLPARAPASACCALLPVEPWWLPVYHGCDAAETCGLPCPAAWLAAVAREQSTESAEMTTGCRLSLKQMWLRTQHLLLPAHLTRHRLGCTLRCVMLWLGAGSGQYC